MYGKTYSNVFFSMMPRYDVNIMYSKVVERKTGYLLAKDHSKIHWVRLEKKLKIKTFTIENVLKCMENVWQKILN